MRNNNKKHIIFAFTIIEVIVVMSIIAVLSAILLTRTNFNNHAKTSNALYAYKALQSIDDTIGQIRNSETEVVPNGLIMVKDASGAYEYAVLSTNGNGALADMTEFAGMVGDYMKKDGDVINFCSVSGVCSDESIKGFRLPGGFYVGFEKLANISDCPSFYMPEDTSVKLDPYVDMNGNTKQCWGKLHIDTNGDKSPNLLNDDYFVFGLDEYGVVTKGREHVDDKIYGTYITESNRCQINTESFSCGDDDITCNSHTQGAECYRTVQ